jgi:hypothetical protein
VFWFSLQILSENSVVTKVRRDININVHRLSCDVPAYRRTGCYSQILMKLEFSGQILEKYPCNFIKIFLMGVELFHTEGRRGGGRDRQTDKQTEP